MRAVLALAATVVMAACAPAAEPVPPAPPPFDPVGTYDFSTQVEGTPIAGSMVVHRDAQGALVARITTPITGEFAASVTVEGRRLALRGNAGDGVIAMTMTVADDDTVTGTWSVDTGESGTFTGKRRPRS